MSDSSDKPVREFTPEEVQRAAEHFMKKHPRYYKELRRRDLADEAGGEDIMWAMIRSMSDIFPEISGPEETELLGDMRNFFFIKHGLPEFVYVKTNNKGIKS
jgi:hypothetical protein